MVKRLRLHDSNGAPTSKKGMDGLRAISPVLDNEFSPWLGELDWTAWKAFLKALRGEKLSKAEYKLFHQCTGRTTKPAQPFSEAFVIAGRRARKSSIASLLAVFFAIFGKWKTAPGEVVSVVICAVSKRQAKICRDFCEGILRSRPAYERLIQSNDHQTILLKNKFGNEVEIVCMASNFRSIRGRTVCLAILEEISFWHDETSANPDTEVYRAIKPSMATIPGALLIGISSPYAKRGLLYQKYRQHYGKDKSKCLIWKAPTLLMNPHVPKDIVEEAFEDDPIAAASEFNAEFRDDIASYLTREAVAACIEKGCRERSPDSKLRYFAFCDFAGGSGRDSATLAIGYHDDGLVKLAAIRERKPKFSPKNVVAEFAETLKSYNVREVIGDRFAGEFPREQFRENGITYWVSQKNKNQLYTDLLPVINSGAISLLDDDRLTNQLCLLERRAGRNGDVIDHPPHASDDLANSLAGVVDCVLSKGRRSRMRVATTGPKIFTGDPAYDPLGFTRGI